jgi:aldehyde dehydrogenase (NAD+)
MNDVARYLNTVDGRRRASSTGQWIASENPFTGETWAEVPRCTPGDVDEAVTAAHRAFRTGAWPALTATARGKLLRRLGDLISRNAEKLAAIEVRDNGKLLAEMAGQLRYIPEWFHYYGGLADKIEGKHIPLGPDYVDYTVCEPMGVSAQIVPWNFPVSIAARSLAPALASGNAVIVKSPELDPLGLIVLARALESAGVPEGAVSILNGIGGDLGAKLVASPRIDQIVFTGSVPTGQAILRAAADNVTPTLMELGGKSAAVAFEGADLDTLLHSVRSGIFFNAGQVCSAMSRLLVQRRLYDRAVEACAELAKGLKAGHGLDEAEHTPVISARQLDSVEALVGTARDDGATIAAGGRRLDRPGHFMAPTILSDVDPKARVAREEVFGPVLCMTPFDTEDEAVRMANGTEFGLVAGIFTRDLARAHRVASRLRAGQVFVNEWFAGGIATPFGGVGKSGFGREKGVEALYNYVRTKNIAISLKR